MEKLKSNVLLFATAIIWGFAFVAQRLGSDFVGNFTYNGIRFSLGALSLIPVFLIFERREKSVEEHSVKMKNTVIYGILAGVMLFTASSFQQWGIEITKSAGKAGFLTGLYTVLVPIFGIVLGKKTGINIWLGAVFAVCGMFLLCVNEKLGIGFGERILILCAVFYALHIIVVDRFGGGLYSLRFACTQFAVCGILGIVLALIFEDIRTEDVMNAAVPILYGGLMSVGVAYTCQILGQKNADPTYASIVFSTESVFSAIGGAIILHEVMTGRGYLGCVLIFAGIVLSQIKDTKLKKR